MSILITGGNGFIGSHLADKLIGEGEDVALLDKSFSSNTESISCRKLKKDVRSYGSVKDAVKNKDAIFHFAAVSRVVWGQERPLECMETNAIGTQNILEAMRKGNSEAILFLGSSREVYGEPVEIPVRETHQKNPISIYGISKMSAENLAMSYRRYFGLKTTIFRFSNVYGTTRDLKERVIPKFILRALKGEPLELYGGEQVLDFMYIEDTLNGILKAYRNSEKIEGEDFHFVSGKGTSVGELAEKIVRFSKSDSKIIKKGGKNFDVRRFVGDFSKAKKVLGWAPKTGLEDGLKKSIENFAV